MSDADGIVTYQYPDPERTVLPTDDAAFWAGFPFEPAEFREKVGRGEISILPVTGLEADPWDGPFDRERIRALLPVPPTGYYWVESFGCLQPHPPHYVLWHRELGYGPPRGG